MEAILYEGRPVFRVSLEQQRLTDDPLSAERPFYAYTACCLLCGLGFQRCLFEQGMRDAYIDPVQMALNEAQANLSNHGCDHARFLRPQIEAAIKNPFN